MQIQRLNSEAVTCQNQPSLGFGPDRQREHSPHPGEAPGIPLLESVKHRFGIAQGMKKMTPAAPLLAQLGVVIDFAVEDKDGVAIVALHRLVAAFKIDDPKANGP